MAAEGPDCAGLRDWYECETIIGVATSGVALKAQTTSGVLVGLKVLWHLSTHQALREVLREIWVMTHFRHPCVLGLRAVHCLTEASVCLATDLMDMTLASLVRSETQCSSDHIRVIMYQLIEALHALNESRVCHTGISLDSVLLNANCDVKLTGFQGITIHGSRIEPCEWVSRRPLCEGIAFGSAEVDLRAAGAVFLQLLTWKILPKDLSNCDLLRLGRKHMSIQPEAWALVQSLLAGDIGFYEALTHPYFLPLGLEPDQVEIAGIEELERLENLPLETLQQELSLHYSN